MGTRELSPSRLIRASLVAIMAVAALIQIPPPSISRAQSDRCQQIAAQAQPLTGDQVTGTVEGPDAPAVWRIDGVVGKTVIMLTGLTADLDLYVCGPEGRLVDHLVAEGTVDETVELLADGPSSYIAVVAADPSRPSGGSYALTVERLSAGAELQRFWRISGSEGHTNFVSSVAFSPDGSLLATGSADRTARLWAADGTPLRTFAGHTHTVTSVAFSPEGSLLATGSSDRTARLWRVADGATAGIFEGHTADVGSVAFSPDGRLLTTGSMDGRIGLWWAQR